jgi:hypothetical protein
MDKLLVTVSQAAVTQAERAIEGCHRCSEQADISFSRVLHSFRRNYREHQVEYILPVLAQCPACCGDIDENTMVKVKRNPPGTQLGWSPSNADSYL